MKNIFILLISIFFFSCEKKEKTYEELEAEVLSDVLPEVIKYELNENLSRVKILSLIQPPDLDSLKYSNKQLDSIFKNYEELNNKYLKLFEQKTDSLLVVLDQFKKHEILLIDTLSYVEKLIIRKNQYLFDSLQPRRIIREEFSKCNLEIKLISYKNTFEGGEPISQRAVVFPTRVLISTDKHNSFFSILKWYGTYHVFCKYSEKLNKWEIDKIVKDSKLEN